MTEQSKRYVKLSCEDADRILVYLSERKYKDVYKLIQIIHESIVEDTQNHEA